MDDCYDNGLHTISIDLYAKCWIQRQIILSCHYQCLQSGRWSETKLSCVRPVALLIGGYNVEEVAFRTKRSLNSCCIQTLAAQDLLADVEVYSPDGRCGGVKVADLPSPRC